MATRKPANKANLSNDHIDTGEKSIRINKLHFAARNRIEELRETINYHNRLYYDRNSPVITDEAWDVLFDELKQLETKHQEFLTDDSPTQQVGLPPRKSFNVIEHRTPMLSLSNAFDADGIRTWHKKTAELTDRDDFAMVTEPKIDGLAISLIYENGELVQASTRGDGTHGEGVTENVRTITSVPKYLATNSPNALEVRGEIYMSRNGFDRLNTEIKENNLILQGSGKKAKRLFANPRNAAAGAVRQLDPTVTASRPLAISIYQLAWADGAVPLTHWETLEWLGDLGFPTTQKAQRIEKLEDVVTACLDWMPRRDTLPFDIDGLVIKIDDINLQERAGNVGRQPRWAVAFKFPAAEGTTTLLDIKVNIGRTGSLTPFAVLDPIRIGGTEIRNATLHNESDIHRRDIRIGDRVIVRRAGDVIPQVVGPVLIDTAKRGRKWKIPSRCPISNDLLINPKGEAKTYCPNPRCPAVIQRTIEHFASRDALDIEGLGERLVADLLKKELIKDVGDIYQLHDKRIALISLERMGEKRIENLLRAIETSKERPFSAVLFGLGIRHVGREVATILADTFLELDALEAANAKTLSAIPGIGPIVGTSIANWMMNTRNTSVLKKLQHAGLRLNVTDGKSEQPLAGYQFTITGRLTSVSRSEAVTLLETLGASVGNTVNQKTTTLITGDKPGNKLTKAKQLGIPIWKETELLDLFQKNKLLTDSSPQ